MPRFRIQDIQLLEDREDYQKLEEDYAKDKAN